MTKHISNPPPPVAVKPPYGGSCSDLNKILNERISRGVEVEDVLYKIAAGQLEVPDATGFRVLAIRLGTPKKQWSDEVKSYEFTPST